MSSGHDILHMTRLTSLPTAGKPEALLEVGIFLGGDVRFDERDTLPEARRKLDLSEWLALDDDEDEVEGMSIDATWDVEGRGGAMEQDMVVLSILGNDSSSAAGAR